MTPGSALQFQIERYRQMTGEQRLSMALNLHAFSREVAREGVKRQHPEADAVETDALLKQRLKATYQ